MSTARDRPLLAAPARWLLAPDEAHAARSLLPRALRVWLHAEQTRVTREVDPRLVAPGDTGAIPAPFLPEAGRVFRLVARWVASSEVRLTDSGLASPAVRRCLVRGAKVLFLAHPLAARGLASWLAGAPAGPELFATATASTRTVLVWGGEGPPFFAKLSVPGELSGECRRLGEREAVACVGVTRLLSAVQRTGPRALELVRETLSVVPRGNSAAGGFVIRELPPAVLAGRTTLVPWFALTHPSRDGDEPLLSSLAAGARGGLTEFVRRRLLRPFLEAWMVSALDQGWTPEAHAQNLLVELDRRGALTGRFFVRDLEGVYADLAFIEQARPRCAEVVRCLPRVRNLTDDYDQLELSRGGRTSLHTYFLGGPIWHLERLLGARGAFRRMFFEELRAFTPTASDPEAFAEWIFDERASRTRRPRVPRRLARWLKLEQTVNERARDPRWFAPVDLSELPARFDPAGRGCWRLEYLEIPEDELELRSWRPSRALRKALFFRRAGRRLVRFFVHPWMRERYGLEAAERGLARGPYWAAPTASPRSLVAWSEDDPSICFGLKLSIDVELQRIRRVVKDSKLARAVALTEVFDAIPERAERQAGFEVLREPISLRFREATHGTIVRELGPRPGRWVPGFSLFADQPRGQLPLAIALAGKGAGARGLAAWFETQLFSPLVRTAAYLMFQQGLIGDLHQQNVLFEKSGRGALSGRLVLRDLDSFKTDAELRARRGLPLRPYTRSPLPADDLKLAGSEAHYDEAWVKQVRAEWVYLAVRLMRRQAAALGGAEAVRAALSRGRLWVAFDRLLLRAAAEHLGDEVVLRELRPLLRARGGLRALRAAAELAARTSAIEALGALEDSLLIDPRAPWMPLYSLNAMVHSWKAMHSWRPLRRRGPLASSAAL